MSLANAQRQISPRRAVGPRFAWALVHAIELHAVVFLAFLPRHASVATEHPAAAADDAVLVEEERSPEPEPSAPPLQTSTTPSQTPGPSRGRARPIPRSSGGSSAPAAAASAIALPDVGEPLPVGLASTYPGGLTSSDGTADAYVDALLAGFGGPTGDLSAPARLGGLKTWGACRADGVPDLSVVRLRALVRADGTAVRVEPLDRDAVSAAVLRGAMPCALRERYLAGRDRQGRPAERWTLPFRVEVLGLLR